MVCLFPLVGHNVQLITPVCFLFIRVSQKNFSWSIFFLPIFSVLGVGRELVSDAVANLAEAFGTL